MKLTDFEKNYVFTTKVKLDDSGNEFIELREPTQAELSGFSEDAKHNLEQMEKIFPNCVVDSSFENEEGIKATGKEIYNELKKSGSLFTEILSEWLNNVPFSARLKKQK